MQSKSRVWGQYLTSKEIFNDFILPEIKLNLKDYIWVDLYAGEGNLILPILENIPKENRTMFFSEHIYLFDLHPDMIKKCISNAELLGIPKDVATQNIIQSDNLKEFPIFLKNNPLSIFHITNPPYLYLGYIRKHIETQKLNKYFKNENTGYQDLYQIAMMNDLRNKITNLIYILPTNFIFGSSVSNKIRRDFLKNYNITKCYIFEKKVFETTGTNVGIFFFRRKDTPRVETLQFNGFKIKKNKKKIKRAYTLKYEYNYRGGWEFHDFIKKYKCKNPLKIKYYLLKEDVQNNIGKNKIIVLDTSNFVSNKYQRIQIYVKQFFKEKIKNNILYVKTLDTGQKDKKIGLYKINEDFDVNGIYTSKKPYRTSPIQLFFTPQITREEQSLLQKYFNFILEYYRDKLDSEFLTTYKYSNAEYTRKYLGLIQTRKIIETLSIRDLSKDKREELRKYIEIKDFKNILNLLKQYRYYKIESKLNI